MKTEYAISIDDLNKMQKTGKYISNFAQEAKNHGVVSYGYLSMSMSEWAYVTHIYSVDFVAPKGFNTEDRLNYLPYDRLHYLMKFSIENMRDHAAVSAASKLLLEWDTDYNESRCLRCDSKAPALMRIWLSRHRNLWLSIDMRELSIVPPPKRNIVLSMTYAQLHAMMESVIPDIGDDHAEYEARVHLSEIEAMKTKTDQGCRSCGSSAESKLRVWLMKHVDLWKTVDRENQVEVDSTA